ncbi:S1C family serine protease [Dethiobacter alkaliphilus]|uniref:2-alkenal reductase n=1 Tax=Dethiobacter alkaliphilus AHT 1 TaxID=555088 RepID=C0GIA9_DETAL|nr:trypsin-like peptidase domain-containing protein [Dethiobacter alkaliphilus]EEG76957.1 2-alkenal reductase [Dethiobacter alkaliphilus AHT 1]
MDFFNGFNQPRNRTGLSLFIVALLGAILGGVLVGLIFVNFAQPAETAPDSFVPGEQDQDIEYTDRDRPEYQNTAVVRAAEEVLPAVVGITNRAMVFDRIHGRSILRERATGTGVIIDSGGYIVTNNHVIEDHEELSVTLADGQEYEASLIGADPATDLAVIRIDKEGLAVSHFGDSDKLAVGETAIAIGNPLGLAFSQSVTVGVISAKERMIEINEHEFTFIQTDAAINDGNSGGPLVNLNGEVIGINTAKIKIAGVEGMGFAIPANTVKNITRDLILHGRIIRPWLGVYWGGDVDESLSEQLNLPVDYGVLIQDVVDGSPAQQAGIRRGDVIIRIDDKQITNFTDLRDGLQEFSVGDEVEVTIIRDGQELTIDTTLAELPEQLD